MKLEIRNISVTSLINSSVPVVVFILGLLGAVVGYLVVPNPQLMSLNIWQKTISIGLYSLLYMLIVSALLVFVAFMYNILTGVLGLRGFVLDLEEVHEE
ncbi:MAG: hypothetical protein HY796_01785 [Elusimicrobia bacterium]|nr:hypothetical protein [Elusimicrobiota bacterium]